MARGTLSVNLESIRGGTGDFTYSMRDGTVILRRKPLYRKSMTPKQQVSSAEFSEASAYWSQLTAEEAEQWNRAAKALPPHTTRLGGFCTPIGYNYFMRLTRKFYQVNTDGTPPRTPPLIYYIGDNVIFTMTAVPGGIEYFASGPNVSPTCTELLIEKIPGVHRKPTQRWQSAGFVTFTDESLTTVLELPPGRYATATRFVNTDNGQMFMWQWGETVDVSGTD